MSTTNILALSHQTSFSDTFIALDNLNQAVDSNQMQAETPLLKVVLHIEVASPQLFPSKDATNDYRRNDPEFLFLDYTAVLEAQNGGDERREIEDFPKQHYLKVCSRPVKIALVITMYNEDVHLFVKSIKAVHENIVYLCDKLGADFWKSFVVVIISDGMKQIDPKVKLALEVMGLFDESVALPQRDNYPVAAHLFQRTTNLIINEDLEVEYKAVPMQCIFLLKQRNARKINSHRWFFSAICQKLNPECCFLLDVGTKPTPQSFFCLYNEFLKHPDIGGAAGEIYVDLGPMSKNLLNPLVAAQNYEYKMSNILDKPLESWLGYISVLPGAFSCYRWNAIKGVPLQSYFHGEYPTTDIQSANLFLAEDRILCWEVCAKQNCNWRLKYVKNARAQTDCPDGLAELISQRRRWLNGSFFAALHSLYHTKSIFMTSHSAWQKLWFLIQAFYNALNVLLIWFSIGNFYITFVSLFNVQGTESPFSSYGELVFNVLQVLYFVAMLTVLVSSLGNRPKGSKRLYYSISVFFAIIMAFMLSMSIYSMKAAFDSLNQKSVWSNAQFRDIVVGLGTTYFSYVLASCLYMDAAHIITSQAQALLLYPTYVNVFLTFSFSNLHDISWGTKGSSTVESVFKDNALAMNAEEETQLQYQWGDDQRSIAFGKSLLALKNNPTPPPPKRSLKEKQQDYEKSFRTTVLIFWLFSNVTLGYLFTNNNFLRYAFPNYTLNPYLTFLFWTVALMSIFRLFGSIMYLSTS